MKNCRWGNSILGRCRRSVRCAIRRRQITSNLKIVKDDCMDKKYELKQKLKRLDSMKGHGTELITVYVASKQPVHEVMSKLRGELMASSNIKDKTTKDHVQTSLTRLMQHLKIYGNLAPESGIVLLCGYLPDTKEFELMALEPPEKFNLKNYSCDCKFKLEPLFELLEPKRKYGVVVLDGRDAILATLSGTRWIVHDTAHSMAHSKQDKGGQSQRRFERLREEGIEYYYKRIGEKVDTCFLGKTEGLIIGGPGPAKEGFLKMKPFNYQIKVLGIVDTGYTDEQGLREVMLSSLDVLKEQEGVKECNLVNEFLRAIRQDGLVEYGLNQVSDAVEKKRATRLLISEEKLGEYKNVVDKATVMGMKIQVISGDTIEGNQFLGMFYGLGVFTKYKARLAK